MFELSASDVAEHLQAILDLRSDLSTTTFDFREEAPAYIDSTRMYKAFNVQDYIRALQLGGYGYNFGILTGTVTTNGDNPFSIFNNGGKSYLIYSVFVGGTNAFRIELYPSTSNPNFTNVGLLLNSKIPETGPNLSLTWQLGGVGSLTHGQAMRIASSAAGGLEGLTNGQVFILPGGTKSGLIVNAVNTGGTAQLGVNASMVELPF